MRGMQIRSSSLDAVRFTLRRIGHALRSFILPAVVALAVGCGDARKQAPLRPASPGASEVSVAPGVRYRALRAADSTVHVLDIDLTRPGVRVGVVSAGLRETESPRYGLARTARGWCTAKSAVAAINGGYFGERDGRRKEIVGLLAEEGVVLSGARRRRGSRGLYARSVFGISPEGVPGIHWATGRRGAPARLSVFAGPESPQTSGEWKVRDAVGCGPTLVRDGRAAVRDREERLVSPGSLPRTLVAYGPNDGAPRLLTLAVAERMEYAEAAAFIVDHFRTRHHMRCKAAMCLDGGGSSQLAYAHGGRIVSAAPSPVTVPTAVVVWAGNRTRSGARRSRND